MTVSSSAGAGERPCYWIRFSRPAHVFFRSTNFCTFPVLVFGSGPNST